MDTSPFLLKGALVELAEPFLGPVPNVVIFQYNPETITRSLKAWEPPKQDPKDATPGKSERASPFDPQESFDLVLELDATDALEFPEQHPIAVASGVSDRLAALELLLYPMDDPNSALAGKLGSLFGLLPVARRSTSKTVIFIYGPGRVVPVRLTHFTVEEQQFSPLLYPIRAKVSIGLQVLPPAAFKDDQGLAKDIAIGAYKFTRSQKELLAVSNLANSVESVLGTFQIL